MTADGETRQAIFLITGVPGSGKSTVADTYFDAGFTVAVQDVVAGPVLPEYVDLISGRPLLVVALVPRPEVVARREAERTKTGYDNGWSIEEFDEGFRRTTPGIGLWLDTSDQTPDETVDEILARAWSEAAV